MARAGSIAVLCLLVAEGVATAQPSPEPAPAREHFQEGIDLFRAERYAAARVAFEQAYELQPNPLVLANIGSCWALEGRPVDAIRTYRRFLFEGGGHVPQEKRRSIEREVAALLREAGDVHVLADPARAEVVLDGVLIGRTPLPWSVAVTPGQHRLEVRAAGHAAYAHSIELSAGQQLSVTVLLERTGGPERASVAVEDARVPALIPRPPRPARSAEDVPLGRGPLLWTGLALTGATAVAATIAGLISLGRLDAYDEASGLTFSERRSAYDSWQGAALATDVLIDVSVVGALATLALFVFAGPEESAR